MSVSAQLNYLNSSYPFSVYYADIGCNCFGVNDHSTELAYLISSCDNRSNIILSISGPEPKPFGTVTVLAVHRWAYTEHGSAVQPEQSEQSGSGCLRPTEHAVPTAAAAQSCGTTDWSWCSRTRCPRTRASGWHERHVPVVGFDPVSVAESRSRTFWPVSTQCRCSYAHLGQ